MASSEPIADAGLGWDDALAAPDLNAAMGIPSGGLGMVRPRPESDTIQPMTMYAIWAGVGAVSLLVLLIVGHILWNAFAGKGEDEAAPGPGPPAQAAPSEPVEKPQPSEGD